MLTGLITTIYMGICTALVWSRIGALIQTNAPSDDTKVWMILAFIISGLFIANVIRLAKEDDA